MFENLRKSTENIPLNFCVNDFGEFMTENNVKRSPFFNI